MAKGGRPPGRGGGGRSRPPKRWDSPPKTSGTGGGTKHGGSTGTRAMVWIAAAIFGLPTLTAAAAVAYGIAQAGAS